MCRVDFFSVMQTFHSRMLEQNFKVDSLKYRLCQIEFINGLLASGVEVKQIYITLAVAGRSVAQILRNS